jgi:hypothetical protein
MRDDRITLITKTGEVLNDNGFPVEGTDIRTEKFARIKSVKASEFYQAYSAGMTLSYIFCVDPDDWKDAYAEVEGQMMAPWAVEYEGILYKIVRTYKTDMGEIELTVKVAGHESEL